MTIPDDEFDAFLEGVLGDSFDEATLLGDTDNLLLQGASGELQAFQLFLEGQIEDYGETGDSQIEEAVAAVASALPPEDQARANILVLSQARLGSILATQAQTRFLSVLGALPADECHATATGLYSLISEQDEHIRQMVTQAVLKNIPNLDAAIRCSAVTEVLIHMQIEGETEDAALDLFSKNIRHTGETRKEAAIDLCQQATMDDNGLLAKKIAAKFRLKGSDIELPFEAEDFEL